MKLRIATLAALIGLSGTGCSEYRPTHIVVGGVTKHTKFIKTMDEINPSMGVIFTNSKGKRAEIGAYDNSHPGNKVSTYGTKEIWVYKAQKWPVRASVKTGVSYYPKDERTPHGRILPILMPELELGIPKTKWGVRMGILPVNPKKGKYIFNITATYKFK